MFSTTIKNLIQHQEHNALLRTNERTTHIIHAKKRRPIPRIIFLCFSFISADLVSCCLFGVIRAKQPVIIFFFTTCSLCIREVVGLSDRRWQAIRNYGVKFSFIEKRIMLLSFSTERESVVLPWSSIFSCY